MGKILEANAQLLRHQHADATLKQVRAFRSAASKMRARHPELAVSVTPAGEDEGREDDEVDLLSRIQVHVWRPFSEGFVFIKS